MEKPIIDGVFSNRELEYFKKSFEGIILYTSDGMPFIDYLKAKEIFEDVVGQDYSYKIISERFYPEFDTYYLHVRFIVERNGSKFEKDVLTGAKGIRKEGETNIFNFEDLGKTAMKDAMKKFFSDYMGIGAKDFNIAKEEVSKKKGVAVSPKELKCSECSINIDYDVYKFSTQYFKAERPLCRNCQDKYKKGLIK